MRFVREDGDPDVLNIITGHFERGSVYSALRPNGASSWLLILTLAGAGLFGGVRELAAKPGDWVLIRPRSPHDYRTLGDRWELLWCHFHPRPHWLPWLRWTEWTPGLMVETPPDQDEIVSAFSACHRLASGNEIHADSLAMNALEAVILRIDQARRTQDLRLDPRIEAALGYASAHLSEPFGLADLAEKVGLSPSRFGHLFRQEIGAAPREFIERMRLDRAAGLLKLTSQTVQNVAAQVGFDNPFYFTLRFKKRTGKSPTEFRRDSVLHPTERRKEAGET